MTHHDAYYTLENGEQKGPYTLNQLIDKAPGIHTRVLWPTENTWLDACDVPELNAYFEAKGIYFPTEDNLASFWWRLLAFMVDFIVLSFLLSFILAILASNGIIYNIKLSYSQLARLQVIVYVTFVAYNFVGEVSPLKGSIGKRMCKLVVVDADGMGQSFGSALLRSAGKALSMFFWGIGFLSVLWTEHRQALHDYIAKTYVIKR